LIGKYVWVIDVGRTPDPVYLKGAKGKEFFISVGNISRALNPEETVGYVSMR